MSKNVFFFFLGGVNQDTQIQGLGNIALADYDAGECHSYGEQNKKWPVYEYLK